MGLSPDEFWMSTPRMIMARFAAQSVALDREHNGRAWMAWHIAALMRCNPRKPLPKFESMLAGRRKAASQKQTPEQMLAMAKMITAAFGGKISIKE